MSEKAERLPGLPYLWVRVRAEEPITWNVKRPPLRPGQGEMWWRRKSAWRTKDHTLALERIDTTFGERIVYMYAPRMSRRWEPLTGEDIPSWSAELPELREWEGEQWGRDSRTGFEGCRRHDPIYGATEYWMLGPGGPERM